MKVAISASEATLDSRTEPRFGRCPWFVIIDTDTGAFEVHSNPGLNAPQGAGVAAAQLVVDKGAGCVITGRLGPRAWQALEAAGVTVIGDADGLTVREALEQYKAGRLRPLSGPAAPGGNV